MSLNLDPGFKAYVEIKNKENVVLYERNFESRPEFKEFIDTYARSVEGWSLTRGISMPLRTQNFKDFSKDIFLPTFVNFCLQINNVALIIITSIFAIALDVITLPIRLLATPFRIYYNYQNPESEHPIVSLIKDNPQCQSALDDNFVNFGYTEEEIIDTTEKEEITASKNIPQKRSKTKQTNNRRIALKKHPGGIVKEWYYKYNAISYLKYRSEEWMLDPNGIHASSRSEQSFTIC